MEGLERYRENSPIIASRLSPTKNINFRIKNKVKTPQSEIYYENKYQNPMKKQNNYQMRKDISEN